MLSVSSWTPASELTSLHRDMDRMFARVWGDVPASRYSEASRESSVVFVPATEVTSSPDAWTLRLALPGVDPDHVQIEIQGTMLTVSGERRHERHAGSETQLSEISYGRFERQFTIPERVDADKVEASFRHGMLELRLPLEEAAKPRRISVRADG